MLKIRLARIGKRNHAMFRMIISEHTRAPQSRSMEILGSINPHTDPQTVQINTERATYWLSQGAQVSERAAYHLKQAGVSVPVNQTEKKSASGKRPEPVKVEAPAPAVKAEEKPEEKKEAAA